MSLWSQWADVDGNAVGNILSLFGHLVRLDTDNPAHYALDFAVVRHTEIHPPPGLRDSQTILGNYRLNKLVMAQWVTLTFDLAFR